MVAADDDLRNDLETQAEFHRTRACRLALLIDVLDTLAVDAPPVVEPTPLAHAVARFDSDSADADIALDVDRVSLTGLSWNLTADRSSALLTLAALTGDGTAILDVDTSAARLVTDTSEPTDTLASTARDLLGDLCLHAGLQFDADSGVITVPCRERPEMDTAHTIRVLVVEDNPTNQLLATKQLERLGVEPVIAPTGLDGVEKASAERFRLILMDWNLPDIDGLEATRRIREAGASADSPIVAMTANAMSGDREACLSAGMNDVLTKPVRMDAIRDVVAEWTTTEQHVDPVALGHRLSVDLGGPTIARSVTAAFLEELDVRIAAIIDGTGEDRRRAAHTLKSTASLLALDELSSRCADIELGRAEPDELALRREAESARRLLGQARNTLAAA